MEPIRKEPDPPVAPAAKAKASAQAPAALADSDFKRGSAKPIFRRKPINTEVSWTLPIARLRFDKNFWKRRLGFWSVLAFCAFYFTSLAFRVQSMRSLASPQNAPENGSGGCVDGV